MSVPASNASTPSDDGLAGTRNRSLAQAPRSMPRHRSPQNGRHRLDGENAVCRAQVGHGTSGPVVVLFTSRTQRQLEGSVLVARPQTPV